MRIPKNVRIEHIPILERPLLSISINSYTSQQFGQPLLWGQKYDSATSSQKLRQNLTKIKQTPGVSCCWSKIHGYLTT